MPTYHCWDCWVESLRNLKGLRYEKSTDGGETWTPIDENRARLIANANLFGSSFNERWSALHTRGQVYVTGIGVRIIGRRRTIPKHFYPNPVPTVKQKGALVYLRECYQKWNGQMWIRADGFRGLTLSVANALVTKGYAEKQDTGQQIGHSNPKRVADQGDIYTNRCRYMFRITESGIRSLEMFGED